MPLDFPQNPVEGSLVSANNKAYKYNFAKKRWITYRAVNGYVPPTKSYTFTRGVLDSSITFSRSSNATIINSAGNIAYAPHNLLTNSESFEAAGWVKTTANITANSDTAPDGTLTADTLDLTTSNSYLLQTVSLTANVSYTFSCYVKTNTGTANFRLFVDFITTSEYTATTNWTRISYTFTASVTASNRAIGFRGAFPSTPFPFLIWGAQLEIGSTATTYNSTTPKNLLGFTEEFDNAAWTKSNSFIQTNLLTYSEAFDNAAWAEISTGTSTRTPNVELAPNGTLTVDKLVGNNINTWPAQDVGTGFQNNTYTFSFWMRADAPVTISAKFAFNGGVIYSQNINLTTTLQRFTFTQTFTSANTQGLRVGWNIGNGNNIYVWGAQLVQGSTPGDYTRTDATAKAIVYESPNGFLNADKLVENTAANSHTLTQSATISVGTVFCFSTYIKKAERDKLEVVSFNGSNGITAIYDFNLGTVVSSSGFGTGVLTSATIIDSGNGWYRISLIGTIPTVTSVTNQIRLYTTTNNYTGDGTSGIYVYGAQLSNSASLDPYVYNPAAALTSVAYYGPRFTYDPVTKAPQGLLIEEQRSNLFINSANISALTVELGAVATDTTTAPDGSLAYKYTEDSATGVHGFRNVTGISITGANTAGIFLKNGNRRYVALSLYVGASYSKGAVIDLQTGTITQTYGTYSVAPTVVNAGNGWWRFSITDTITATSFLYISACNSATPLTTAGRQNRAGDGSSYFYAWGAQLEAGAFATSYIPTGASTVTRAADIAVVQGNNFSNWFNVNEGSFYAKYTSAQSSDNGVVWSVSDGTSSNLIWIKKLANNLTINTLGVTQAGIAVSNIASAKTAAGLKTNSVNLSMNGAIGVEDTVVTLPAVNRMNIGGRESSAIPVNGTIQQINYYGTRLTNSQLQALTV
jgi:hypothetical protein